MPTSTSRPRVPGVAGTPASGTVPVGVVLMGPADGPGGLPDADGVRCQRVATSVELAAAVRGLRRGVIAIAAPPATDEDITLVARARTQRDGLRALLVNDEGNGTGRVGALSIGFDDAVPGSVLAEELRGRIAVLLDRTREDARDRLPVGNGAELDLTARALRRHGRLIRLRPMEFRLLEELARNPGRPVTREWLLRRVWGSHELDGSRTVDVHIRWLRAKVERDPENPEHLLTVRGVGYQLELGQESEPG